MIHDRFEEMLARRSELTPEEEGRLQAHLGDCPQCRDTAHAYEQQGWLLRSLPSVEPPVTLRAGVLAGIQRVQPRRRWWSPRPIALLGPAAAVLMVVGVLALHNLHTGGGSTNTAGPAVPTVPVSNGPTFGTGRTSKGNEAHPPPLQPHGRSSPHAPVLTVHGQSPVPQAAPTNGPAGSDSSLAIGPAPTAAVPDVAFRPAVTSAPLTHSPGRTAAHAPVKAAAPHPVPTSLPAPKPPIVAAPARPPSTPAPTPVALTPGPVIDSTTPAGGVMGMSPAATSTPTATPQP